MQKRVVVISVVLHVMLGLGLLFVPDRSAKHDDTRRIDIVFHRPEIAEPEPIEIAEVKPPEPEPPPIEPEPVPEPPRVEPEPVKRPKPKPKRVVRTAMLDEPAPSAPAPKAAPKRTTRTAGFASVAAAEQPAATRNTRVIAAGSFSGGDINVPRQSKTAPRDSVIQTGFDENAGDQPSASRATGSVQQGGFGDGVAPEKAPRQRRAASNDLDTPVEIVSKPTPVYTDKARNQRIEGAVVLEVTFGSNGQLRVVRVVQGLGHGLDESAVEAANKIRFNPAKRDGRPVDHTTTLRVVFRLA